MLQESFENTVLNNSAKQICMGQTESLFVPGTTTSIKAMLEFYANTQNPKLEAAVKKGSSLQCNLKQAEWKQKFPKSIFLNKAY